MNSVLISPPPLSQVLWRAVCQGAGQGAGRGGQHEQPPVQLSGQDAAGEGARRRDWAAHDQQGDLQVPGLILDNKVTMRMRRSLLEEDWDPLDYVDRCPDFPRAAPDAPHRHRSRHRPRRKWEEANSVLDFNYIFIYFLLDLKDNKSRLQQTNGFTIWLLFTNWQ